MKRIHWFSAIVLLAVASLTLSVYLYGTAPSPILDESEAVEAAMDFLMNYPTFTFDGIEDSIVIDEVIQVQQGWSVRINFNCSHPGYGNRIWQPLLQVITPHQILITMREDGPSYAVIDYVWDEIAQSYLYTEESEQPQLDRPKD